MHFHQLLKLFFQSDKHIYNLWRGSIFVSIILIKILDNLSPNLLIYCKYKTCLLHMYVHNKNQIKSFWSSILRVVWIRFPTVLESGLILFWSSSHFGVAKRRETLYFQFKKLHISRSLYQNMLSYWANNSKESKLPWLCICIVILVWKQSLEVLTFV